MKESKVYLTTHELATVSRALCNLEGAGGVSITELHGSIRGRAGPGTG